MKISLASILVVGLLFVGCSTTTTNALNMLSLDNSSLEERQLQTRVYETSDDKKIFDASIAALQDLEYTIGEVDREFGIITGSKSASAREAKQMLESILMAIFTSPDGDATQYIRTMIVVIPKPSEKKTYVRITIQRVVYNVHGYATKAETIKDEKIYQKFFEVLSKAVFLEGYK